MMSLSCFIMDYIVYCWEIIWSAKWIYWNLNPDSIIEYPIKLDSRWKYANTTHARMNKNNKTIDCDYLHGVQTNVKISSATRRQKTLREQCNSYKLALAGQHKPWNCNTLLLLCRVFQFARLPERSNASVNGNTGLIYARKSGQNVQN